MGRFIKHHNWIQKHKKTLVIVSVILLLLLAFDLSPFGGNIRFYAKWIECGQKPVRVALVIEGVQYYEESPVFDPVHIMAQQYYCTPLDAEKAGYSASRWDYQFPHINNKQ